MSAARALNCSTCTNSTPDFLCEVCGAAFCLACIVGTHHAAHPFHRIQTWTGYRINPSQLGLRLRLGHNAGAQCPHPVFLQDFPIITVGGVVRMDIVFCGCAGAPSQFEQLMEASLLPSAVVNPVAAVEFGVVWSINSIFLANDGS
ncbi:hypothetical protein DFH07DRAFT_766878 [Mycena maculata]|uniref:B box-type domain-containing protein n=1 Tax=Mycena maculata TaxID=230809 RepID=A0AAD7K0N0_9AGAR|nr:hypothetical protein DFH07DRAFT_766878 [Mycena maculata]